MERLIVHADRAVRVKFDASAAQAKPLRVRDPPGREHHCIALHQGAVNDRFVFLHERLNDAELLREQAYVDGSWCEAESGERTTDVAYYI